VTLPKRQGLFITALFTTCITLASWLILRTWQWWRHVHPKHLLTLNELHDVIFQKIEIFKIFTDLQVSRQPDDLFDETPSVSWPGPGIIYVIREYKKSKYNTVSYPNIWHNVSTLSTQQNTHPGPWAGRWRIEFLSKKPIDNNCKLPYL
jgi:hypothetical protein